MPRYKSFITSARRAEAKVNLHNLHTLQEAYKAEHGTHHAGLNIGYFKDGRKIRCDDVDDSEVEMDNKLGFRPNNCQHLRYGYTTSSGGGKAFGPSDAHQRWIYPDCKGCGSSACGEDQGDVITMGADGEPTLCRNITKYCPDDIGCGGSSSPGTTCTPSCGAWTIGTPTLVDTTIVLANECECNTFPQTQTDNACLHTMSTRHSKYNRH